MFDETHTRPVLADICRLIGRPHGDAVLLRHHTNAVYAVGDLVIKIAPPAYDAARIQRVAELVRWLTDRGFPTVPLWEGVTQPVQVGGHVATIWRRLAHPDPIVTADLGTLLRELHALPIPPIALPGHDPIAGIRHSLATSAILTDADRALLNDELSGLVGCCNGGALPMGERLIQSDPQVRNALRRPDGVVVLADWDGARIGPPEWDLATVAVHCRRFGTAADFDTFTRSYGYDLSAWTGFADLCRLRELQMIATNARKSVPGSTAAQEVHHRIAGLRRQDKRRWHIL